jgi:hypothetical protein
LAAIVKSKGGGGALNSRQLAERARGTSNEAQSLAGLGVNLKDPAIRQAVLDRLTPGTKGMLSIGGAVALTDAELDAIIAEAMGGYE